MYEELDKKIVLAVRRRDNPLYAGVVRPEANRIEEATGRESYRIIDARLQALRKKGVIRYKKGPGAGWVIVDKEITA